MQISYPANEIIGGMFGLQATSDSGAMSPPFLQDQNLCLVNARSAIRLLVGQLTPQQVWCPSYLCHTILEAIRGTMAGVRFYEVNYDLVIASYDWLDQVQEGDLVIFIDYFGFIGDPDCAVRARKRGAWVLEDASQALLSGIVGRFSDFILYSPRKFVGIPDGGILCNHSKFHFQHVDLMAPPSNWWRKAFLASVLRREFDIHGGTRQWFELFQETEPNAPIGSFAMSELSRVLLQNNFDYTTIAQRRVGNYHTLADKLGSLALFPHLPDQIVPLGFPIRMKNRDVIRQVLFAHEIYPPVHWPIPETVPREYVESHKLAAEVMTLPCDQRYDSSDMNRIAEVVAEGLGW